MRSAISVIGHYGMSLLMDVKHFPAIGETVEGSKLEFEPGAFYQPYSANDDRR